MSALVSSMRVEDAVLISHELVDNAIDHARTRCRVTGAIDRLHRADLRVRPLQRCAGPADQGRHALRGRGIRIVAGSARRWCWNDHRGGKKV